MLGWSYALVNDNEQLTALGTHVFCGAIDSIAALFPAVKVLAANPVFEGLFGRQRFATHT